MDKKENNKPEIIQMVPAIGVFDDDGGEKRKKKKRAEQRQNLINQLEEAVIEKELEPEAVVEAQQEVLEVDQQAEDRAGGVGGEEAKDELSIELSHGEEEVAEVVAEVETKKVALDKMNDEVFSNTREGDSNTPVVGKTEGGEPKVPEEAIPIPETPKTPEQAYQQALRLNTVKAFEEFVAANPDATLLITDAQNHIKRIKEETRVAEEAVTAKEARRGDREALLKVVEAARKEWAELRKKKPPMGDDLHPTHKKVAEEYKEKIILLQGAWDDAKREYVEFLLENDNVNGRAFAQEFLLSGIEFKKSVEKSGWDKFTEKISKGIKWWESVGNNPEDNKYVRGAKKIAKATINVAIIGGAGALVVSGGAALGIGSAAALSGGIGSYIGGRMVTSTLLGGALSVLPPGLQKVGSVVLSATSVAGITGLLVSKGVGLATKKWWSEEAIEKSSQGKKSDLENKIEVNFDEAKLAQIEKEIAEILKAEKNKRLARRVLAGASALATSVAILELSVPNTTLETEDKEQASADKEKAEEELEEIKNTISKIAEEELVKNDLEEPQQNRLNISPRAQFASGRISDGIQDQPGLLEKDQYNQKIEDEGVKNNQYTSETEKLRTEEENAANKYSEMRDKETGQVYIPKTELISEKTIAKDEGLTQALKDLYKGGSEGDTPDDVTPKWLVEQLGENPTKASLAEFATKIGVYDADAKLDSLVVHEGDKIGFDANENLILERNGESFVLAKDGGGDGFVKGDWEEEMQNEKFMDTDKYPNTGSTIERIDTDEIVQPGTIEKLDYLDEDDKNYQGDGHQYPDQEGRERDDYYNPENTDTQKTESEDLDNRIETTKENPYNLSTEDLQSIHAKHEENMVTIFGRELKGTNRYFVSQMLNQQASEVIDMETKDLNLQGQRLVDYIEKLEKLTNLTPIEKVLLDPNSGETVTEYSERCLQKLASEGRWKEMEYYPYDDEFYKPETTPTKPPGPGTGGYKTQNGGYTTSGGYGNTSGGYTLEN